MSGEYGTWSMAFVELSAKNLRTRIDVWEGALSWWKIQELWFDLIQLWID